MLMDTTVPNFILTRACLIDEQPLRVLGAALWERSPSRTRYALYHLCLGCSSSLVRTKMGLSTLIRNILVLVMTAYFMYRVTQ